MVLNDEIVTFCSFYNVSRETIDILEKYEKILIRDSKSLNLIGKSTFSQIWNRHFLDSFQVIDYIDKSDKVLTDIGSGAGFPGLVLAIAAAEKKMNIKINLIDKSSKKIEFLKKIILELKLNVDVICENIMDEEKKITGNVFTARAFKPLPVILKLIHEKIDNFNKFFVFLGKTGKQELLQVSKSWDIKYKQRMSVTSNDSFILEINSLKKKN